MIRNKSQKSDFSSGFFFQWFRIWNWLRSDGMSTILCFLSRKLWCICWAMVCCLVITLLPRKSKDSQKVPGKSQLQNASNHPKKRKKGAETQFLFSIEEKLSNLNILKCWRKLLLDFLKGKCKMISKTTVFKQLEIDLINEILNSLSI